MFSVRYNFESEFIHLPELPRSFGALNFATSSAGSRFCFFVANLRKSVGIDPAVDQSSVVAGDVWINVGTDTREIPVRNRVALVATGPVAFVEAENPPMSRPCLVHLHSVPLST